MSCRHDLALGLCATCYPETGIILPDWPGDSLDGPGALEEERGWSQMTWDELVALAKRIVKHNEEMLSSKEQKRLDREAAISFVYGNCKLSNPSVTREMVEAAYDARCSTKPCNSQT